MGPYMRPIPVGASAAMVFSLVVAFVVTPWAAVRLLKPAAHHDHGEEDLFTRLYRRVMGPLIASGRMRALFLAGVAVLLLAAIALVPLELVTVKMLPFDNKSEFQVMVDMPEGTALETTARVASALAVGHAGGRDRRQRPAVRRHVGAVQLQRPRASLLPAARAAPRRSAGEPRAEGRALGAEPRRGPARARPAAADRPIVRRHAPGGGGAAGPARPADARRRGLRPGCRRGGRRWPRRSRRSSSRRPAWWIPTGTSRRRTPKVTLAVDGEKAAAAGLSPAAVASVVRMAGSGEVAGLLHDAQAREDVPIVLRLPRADRSLEADPVAAAERDQARGRRRAHARRAHAGRAEPVSQEPAGR